MTPTEVATILRRFSEWRLTEDEALIFEIGEAIDVAVGMLERLEAVETDALAKLEVAEKERDNLRAERDKLKVQNSCAYEALVAIADWNNAWGPFPETKKGWRGMAIVKAREAVRVFE